jgi:hypothetical protein
MAAGQRPPKNPYGAPDPIDVAEQLEADRQAAEKLRAEIARKTNEKGAHAAPQGVIVGMPNSKRSGDG